MSRSRRRGRPASSARQGAGIVGAAFACLLLAPVIALTSPASAGGTAVTPSASVQVEPAGR
jgi:hypothetical protein